VSEPAKTGNALDRARSLMDSLVWTGLRISEVITELATLQLDASLRPVELPSLPVLTVLVDDDNGDDVKDGKLITSKRFQYPTCRYTLGLQVCNESDSNRNVSMLRAQL
jgi:hypothetical protein